MPAHSSMRKKGRRLSPLHLLREGEATGGFEFTRLEVGGVEIEVEGGARSAAVAVGACIGAGTGPG